jgi:hypothetical protein
MPGAFDQMLDRHQRERALGEQISARRAQMQEQAALREYLSQQTQAAITARMQNNPRTLLMQNKQRDVDQQNTAYSNYVLGMDPATVPPEMRRRLEQMKAYISSNPGLASSGVAKMFLQQAKPHGIQLKATQTMDPDSGMPLTSYEVFDPMTAGLGPVSAGPGTTRKAPASSEADDLFNSLVAKHGLGSP